MIIVLSTDEEISAGLLKFVREQGIEAVATDDVAEALRLAPDASGILFDQIPTDLDGEALRGAPVPLVVVSIFSNRPVLITPDRIPRPFTLEWLRFAITTLEPEPLSRAA